ncbi:glutamate racemase [Parendozoicomonas sp. Alg238-R29]|uniref:glutamate racemase n=1 Tax=Parendozoicomonas sp. Alg238-R29 TaxID=2993446 RepID=UPI00248DF2CD|nr:glutamate racemase [Parendozoicomonas sp. Alg238-R29]
MHPIVIMDSGAGGLTVFEEISRMMPWLPVIYCADNAGFPYGPRSEEDVVHRVSHYLGILCQKHTPSLAVLACNTASTVALTRIRKELTIPIVGVVPAIKTAATHSRNKCIGLLATPGTVKRSYTDNLIEDFASDCEVIRAGSTRLVHLAENKLHGEPVEQHEFDEILEPFKSAQKKPDHIVLGCTHFPLVREELSKSMPDVTWVDSGEAIARRVSSLLGDITHTSDSGPVSEMSVNHLAVFTGENEALGSLARAFKMRGFDVLDHQF